MIIKNLNKLLFVLILSTLSSSAWALEIDEKLTLRVVKTSESKKTILINRGIEDGIAKGDHAKFFLSVGVVARAVVIRVSPTRSVWSVYRLVNAAQIKDDQVMKLKITPAVKVTKDESRMLVTDDVGLAISKDPRDLGIPLADGADDLAKDGSAEAPSSANALWAQENVGNLIAKNKEVFGSFYYSQGTSKTTPDNNTTEYTQTIENMRLTAGAEWYFKDESKWYSRLSLLGLLSISRSSAFAHQGAFVKETSLDFGGGVNIYPTTRPSLIHRFIPYIGYNFLLGSSNSQYTPGKESTSQEQTLDASVLEHNFLFGYKYYTVKGIGLRLELVYNLRSDKYAKDTSSIAWLKNTTGPKVQLGISRRF